MSSHGRRSERVWLTRNKIQRVDVRSADADSLVRNGERDEVGPVGKAKIVSRLPIRCHLSQGRLTSAGAAQDC